MGSRHASHSDSNVLNRPRLERLTRLSCASGMRYQVPSARPIRAQIEPFSGLRAIPSTLMPRASRRWDAAVCATTSTRCGAGSVAGARWCGRVRRSSSWSCHPIAHSAAVPPKFEPSAIGIRALEPSHSEDRFLASVTPIRRPAPTSGCPRTGRLHAGQNGDVGPHVPRRGGDRRLARWATDGSTRASRRRR